MPLLIKIRILLTPPPFYDQNTKIVGAQKCPETFGSAWSHPLPLWKIPKLKM